MEASFGRRLWAVLFTGIPFAVFKLGGGLAAAQDIAPALGVAIVVWAGIDVLLNGLALVWPRRFAFCLLANLGRLIDRRGGGGHEQFWLAVDTLLAFAIVASMIWFGRTATLPGEVIAAWELAVIASVLGVGVQRVWDSYRQRRA